LIYQLQSMEIPIIAMVHGYAVGAGMNICLACDLVLASEDAIFCQSFARIGLIPDAGGLYFLPRLVGVHRAKELMFSARKIDAAEALRLGIINSVFPREALEGETLKMACSLAGGPRYAQGLIKRLMNQGLDASLPVFLEMEAAAQALCFNSPENREGVQAFLQKRSPQFQKPESRQNKEES
jgi:2-(1,2-epoxy-1,2-dihydrophenyl)acetyl-CoA isomerase